jgi:hypothetical protein
MAQVLTNDNMVEFIQTRQAPEFKVPEAKPADAPAAEPSKEGTAPDASKDAPRDLTTGKFVKADGEKPAKAEGETAAPAAESDDDDPALTEKIRKLIAKKHRAMKEAEEFGRDEARRALAAEQRAEALQKQIDALAGTKSGTGPASGEAVDSDEPKPEDFKTVGEYTRALTKYEVAKAKREGLENASKQREQSQAAERAETFAKRQTDFMKATPDYEDVVGEADFDFPNVGMQYMVESEYGPQLAYHFAKNPSEADRLRTLSPGRVLAELGKLEAKFEKQPEPAKPAVVATPSVSRAPAPIIPLEGKSTTVAKDPSQMTFQELRAHRMAERAAGKR